MNQSKASKFITHNGVFYMISGILMLAWPGMVQTIYKDPPFAGNEQVLFRVIGFLLFVIGWFYFFGGKTGSKQFAAASVPERIILTPAMLIPVAMAGVVPHISLAFAILDPILALITWYLLSKKD